MSKKKKPIYYWTLSNIKKEVSNLIRKIGHFPTARELERLERNDLCVAIKRKAGGFVSLRNEMGFKLIKKPHNFWKDVNIIKKEMEKVIDQLGHFPEQKELQQIGREDLHGAISQYTKGLLWLRTEMGYERNKMPIGYWNIETIKEDLSLIIEEIGHFPSSKELRNMERSDLAGVINTKAGGYLELRKVMGYPLYPINKAQSYNNKKGRNAEKIIIKVLVRKFKEQNFIIELNKKLDDKRRLELVIIESGSKFSIGIDVTTSITIDRVEEKWSPENKEIKGYHFYVDKLIIIVVSDHFSSEQYLKWNEICPSNVSILYWKEIEKYFDIIISNKDKRKLDLLARCNFYNKEQIKQEWRSYQLDLNSYIN